MKCATILYISQALLIDGLMPLCVEKLTHLRKIMARNPNTDTVGQPFNEATVEAVWEKGTREPAYSTFRSDVGGAFMQRSKYGKTEEWGWEIDHVKPVSAGGTDDLSNLQPLQWENNRHKGDNYPRWECKVKS
jgi:hypothetical protein